MNVVRFGEKYRDSITGREGIATARTEYQNGCVRVLLEWGNKDGDPHECWFDEQRLFLAESGERVEITARAGGPGSAPPRRDPV